jgi:hypothetical protein
MTTNKYARLGTVLPELTAEIVRLLHAEGELTLALKFEFQPFLRWCSCGDEFCQSFYTQPPPDGAYGPGHRTVCLSPDTGMINIDVVGDDIRYVEILYRPEVRGQLRVMPGDPPGPG